MQDRDEFYKKLKSQLDDTSKWPNEYLYKFIMPAKGDGMEKIKYIFGDVKAVISTRKSKTGKYISASIKVIMPSSDAIIQKYKACESIENIVSL